MVYLKRGMQQASVVPFTADVTDDAARMMARAFVTNPLHVSAFGDAQLAKNEAFFRTGLAAMKGTRLVALDGSGIVGLVHWVRSPDCQFSGLEKLRMMPAMLGGLGLRSGGRLVAWLGTWAAHDPAEPQTRSLDPRTCDSSHPLMRDQGASH